MIPWKYLLAAAAALLVQSAAAEPPQSRIIETYGHADAYLQPKRLAIHLTVEARSMESPLMAYDGLTARLDAIRESLEKEGVDTAEITTEGLGLTRERLDHEGRQRRGPWVASLTMRVRRPLDPDDPRAAAKFLRQIVKAGLTGFSGLLFEVDEDERRVAQAKIERRAVLDAWKRAEAAAAAAGMVLGPPLSIAIGPGSYMEAGIRAQVLMQSAPQRGGVALDTGRGARISAGVEARYEMTPR